MVREQSGGERQKEEVRDGGVEREKEEVTEGDEGKRS